MSRSTLVASRNKLLGSGTDAAAAEASDDGTTGANEVALPTVKFVPSGSA
jgi:hypothetical protein